MATGRTGGSPSRYGARPTPPGNALLAKEAAAQKQVEAGAGPSVAPLNLAGSAVHALLHGTQTPAQAAHQAATFRGQTVHGDPAFTPVTAGLTALLHLPQIVGGAHRQAVELAHPSGANPPSLHREFNALLSGALGFPRQGVNEPKPHPLIAAKPTVQRGPAPTVKTLGEAVTGGLKGARTARTQQEALRSQERGRRAEAFGKALQADPTAAGAKAARAHLAGEYPKVKFGGFDEFTPEAHDAMVKFITDHPNLGPFEPVRATKALEKIRAGVTPQKGEEKLLRKVFGPDVTKELMHSVSRFRELKALGFDVANIPRSIMASVDASGLARQSLLVATGHPRLWVKNVPEYLKAIGSEKKYEGGMADLHQHPLVTSGRAEQMGIDLTEMSTRDHAVAREEPFRSTLAERIPGVKASGRGYTLGLNKNRLDLAQLIDDKAHRLEGKMIPRIRLVDGRPKVVREAVDPNDPALMESIGRLVNSANGRGDLGTGPIGRSQEALNLLLFSPRLIKSRVDFLNPFWYAKLHPVARHEAYRAMAGLVGLVSLALTLAHEAGVPVPLDPRRSDFGKINLGHTHIDLAGGFLQYTRILSEIATQQKVSTSGKVSNLGGGYGETSDLALVMTFLRGKLAPLASGLADVAARRNIVGQPLTFNNSVVSRLTPLSGQDAVSVGKDTASATGSVPGGVAAGIGAFLLSGIGSGVQNYTPKQPKTTGQTGYGARRGGGSSYGRRNGGGSSYGSRP